LRISRASWLRALTAPTCRNCVARGSRLRSGRLAVRVAPAVTAPSLAWSTWNHGRMTQTQQRHEVRLAQLKAMAGDRLLRHLPYPADSKEFRDKLRALPEADRVEILRSCVALMPQFRRLDDYAVGSLLYDSAVLLYGMGLSLSESDLSELLRTASHACGHGSDVRPPFELARDYMRRHGYTAALHDAIEDYRDALPRTHTSQLQHVRRSIDILAVLRPSPPPRRGVRAWSAEVADALARLDATELARWQQLVLSMSVREPHSIPRTWAGEANAFVGQLGPDLVTSRLGEFWPQEGTVVSLNAGGAQLLKHFIWLLALLPDRQVGAELVARIPTLTWHRRDPPMGVLKPAAAYLEEVDSSASRRAREMLRCQIDDAQG
jgi:hypothetical protein